MGSRHGRFCVAAILVALVSSGTAAVTVRTLDKIKQVKPAGAILAQSYTGLGIDSLDNLYVIWGNDGFNGTSNITPDCFIFKYDLNADEASYLGSLSETASAAGNLHAGEGFMKGHSHIVQLGGKMFFGTQAFHDLSGGSVSDTSNYRGGHIFSIDIATGTLIDESAYLTQAPYNGVHAPHHGVIAVTPDPWRNQIVGYTVPTGNIILYKPDTRDITTIPGVSGEATQNVGREIIVTPQGKVHQSYRYGSHQNFIWDLNTSQRTGPVGGTSQGFMNGQVRTRDGSKVYIVTYGKLYELTTATDQWRELATIYSDGSIVVWGLAASYDEKKLYYVTSYNEDAWISFVPEDQHSADVYQLFEYDLETGSLNKIYNLAGAFTKSNFGQWSGSQVTDSQGRIYFLRHDDWQGPSAPKRTDDGDVVQFDLGIQVQTARVPRVPRSVVRNEGAVVDAYSIQGRRLARGALQHRGTLRGIYIAQTEKCKTDYRRVRINSF